MIEPFSTMRDKDADMAVRKYIFVHIPKTAGRSILSALCVRFHNEHKTILDYCREIGETAVQERFKFTCVRNPWDRAVSWWSFFGSMETEPIEFESWLKKKSIVKHRLPTQKFALDQMSYCRSPKGDVMIDHFVRLENIDSDFQSVAKRFGIPNVIPTIGKDDRKMKLRTRAALLRSKHPELAPLVASEDYREMYTTQESIDIVARLDSETIRRFGYSFP